MSVKSEYFVLDSDDNYCEEWTWNFKVGYLDQRGFDIGRGAVLLLVFDPVLGLLKGILTIESFSAIL